MIDAGSGRDGGDKGPQGRRPSREGCRGRRREGRISPHLPPVLGARRLGANCGHPVDVRAPEPATGMLENPAGDADEVRKPMRPAMGVGEGKGDARQASPFSLGLEGSQPVSHAGGEDREDGDACRDKGGPEGDGRRRVGGLGRLAAGDQQQGDGG